MKDSTHLQWIHDRLVTVHKESENYDYMHRLRRTIAYLDALERHFPDLPIKLDEEKDRKSKDRKSEP